MRQDSKKQHIMTGKVDLIYPSLRSSPFSAVITVSFFDSGIR
jgi:hypothetical protein